MFWKYHTGAVSPVDTLLDKEGVTLTEILEQEDIIQECKSQNKKLVDFLTRPEILSELLDLILQEPSEELDERLRFKLPNIASEVITCDVNQINEKLSSDTALLDKLYAFLEASPPLNPLLTSFFSKAFGVLITRRSEQNWYSYQYTCLQVIEYIKSKPQFTSLLITHLSTSAVMDLLLRLITCVEGMENKQNILKWLDDEKLIQRVLSLFSHDGGGNDPEQQDNAGQLLVEIIRSCRDSQLTAVPAEKFHNPLLATAESEDTVNTLLGHMLDTPAPVESVIVNSVEVLLSLLEVRRPAPQAGFYSYSTEPDISTYQADIDRQEAVVTSTVQCLIPRLSQITNILLSPPAKPAVATTAGVLQVPLGKSRLALAKLLSALIHSNSPNLNKALAEANTMKVLLDLFFEYSLNNFLHAQVESCVRGVIFWCDKKKEEDDLDTTKEINETEQNPPDTSSLETPKVDVDTTDDSKEDTPHPLDTITFENPALVHLLTNANLLDRLIKVWSDPIVQPTVAYMGHVTRISNDLVTACGHTTPGLSSAPPVPACQSRTLLLQLMAKYPSETQEQWNGIVSGKLTDKNKMNEIKPASEDKRLASSDDEDSDFRDIQFPQDSVLEKMFSDYQMQEMSENFIDSFGFQDDEFADSDINSSSPPPEAEDEDPWADKTTELSFSNKRHEIHDNSSDEENEAAPDKMEVDNDQDPWGSTGDGGVAMDTSSSPWDTPSSDTAGGGETGWADFDAFSGVGNTSNDVIEKQQSEVMNVEDKPEDENSDSWRPSMASSPEATMLDCSDDIIIDNLEKDAQNTTSDSLPEDNSSKSDSPEDSTEQSDVKDEQSLQDNFAFLSEKGMIADGHISNKTEDTSQKTETKEGDSSTS